MNRSAHPDAGGESRCFHVLDALRGVAALLIVLRHTPDFWGPVRFQETYLAVDLFFVMSGVVIAHAYEARLLAGLSVRRFMLARLIRLYPLYLLGLFLGALEFLMNLSRLPVGSQGFAAAAFLMNLVFLPYAGTIPFNPPSWSLGFELVANWAYAALRPAFGRAGLIAASAVGAAALTLGALRFGTGLDIGWTPQTFPFGFARVFAEFPLGVLLYGLYRRPRRRPSTINGVRGDAACVLIVTLAVLALLVHPSPVWRAAYDLGCALLVFPALVYVALDVRPARLTGACGVAGLISYPVYVNHAPLGALTQRALLSVGWTADAAAPVSGLGLLAALCVLAVIIGKHVDPIVRRWLTDRVGRVGPQGALGSVLHA